MFQNFGKRTVESALIPRLRNNRATGIFNEIPEPAYTGGNQRKSCGNRFGKNRPRRLVPRGMHQQVRAIRKMHIRVMEETELMPADEMLYPENYWFLADVLSYVAVGARSVEDQQHRLTVSGMDVPAGMKNPTSGDFSVMLNSVIAAQAKQSFIYRNWEVETPGNPLAHTILRGAVNKHGQNIPNYHYEDLIRLANMYKTKDLLNPACIVDANHSNSGKMYAEQIRITKEVIHSRNHSNDVKQLVKGVMIESYIEPGCQKVGEGVYGKSITDPCLGWEESEKLLYTIADMLK